MARKPRLHVRGGLYHVILRTSWDKCGTSGVRDKWGQAWHVA